jgi:hypothetical protein
MADLSAVVGLGASLARAREELGELELRLP